MPAVATTVAAASTAAMPAGMLQLHTSAPSWIEVNDGRGQPLVSRLMKAGESAGVDGVPPLRVRIGNASGTQIVFRGQPTDLKAFTRDNVARLELR
jgi:cytoskeleton protein RodZ